MSYDIGIDIGGTFTDCVAVSDSGEITHVKVPTTPHDFSTGIFDGVRGLAETLKLQPRALLHQARRFSHGTTIGTNILAEKRGARVGYITTRGHADAIRIMRGAGRTQGLPLEMVFHVQETSKPEPLVPRTLIREVDERIDWQGRTVVALDRTAAEAAVRELVELERVDAVAICLLWSFRNPAHEELLETLVRALAPRVFLSSSHRVSPRLGEYERAVATIINAYVGPASTAYLSTTENGLHELGYDKPLLIMQCGGGVITSASAKQSPLLTIGSGPVGGVMASVAGAALLGEKNVIITDMGGTTFDAGIIVGGKPQIGDEVTIDRYAYGLTQIDIKSIACGGGSIAWVDEHSRSIRVGPRSAGAQPGPVCYGRGGTQPTVTDADVVLGLLDPEGFLGGRQRLDRAGAERAVAALGRQVGLDLHETASGIIRINNLKAASLIRQETIARGYDPRDFVIFAFGGAGPVHAFGYAPELGARGVVIPQGNGASTFSAYGIASSDLVRYLTREKIYFTPFDAAALDEDFRTLSAEARAAMREEGVADEHLEVRRTVSMRYRDQLYHKLDIPVPAGALDAAHVEELVRAFAATYEALYGAGAGLVAQGMEIFSLRCDAIGRLGTPVRAAANDTAAARAAEPGGRRPIYWPDTGRLVDTPVYDGNRVRPGERMGGPASVELPFTTINVGAGQQLVRDAAGNFILSL